jgi:hypothetical protein
MDGRESAAETWDVDGVVDMATTIAKIAVTSSPQFPATDDHAVSFCPQLMEFCATR